MLLKVGFGGRDNLDGDELEAALLEAADDVTDEATLGMKSGLFLMVY